MVNPQDENVDASQPGDDPIFINARLELPLGVEHEVGQLLPIVTGAHLRAELADRALADRMARRIRAIRRREDVSLGEGLIPVVLTNDTDLLMQPAIVIGEPGVNAASAHWGARLPKAFVVDGSHQILLDPEGIDQVACLWGAGPAGTEAAADHFERHYLEDWLESVAAV
jgi:hypothetical protein